MDCRRANELIMKYMDSEINENEALELHNHTEICDECRGMFALYSEIMDGFDMIDEIEAPSGFEDDVMAGIANVVPGYRQSFTMNLGCIILSVFSALAGLGTLLVIWREYIMEYMVNTPGLDKYTGNFQYISGYLDRLGNSLVSLIQSVQLGTVQYAVEIQLAVVLSVILGILIYHSVAKRSRVGL